jgi:hypothetical protein
MTDTFRPVFCRACGGRIGEVSTVAFRLDYAGRESIFAPATEAPVTLVVTTRCLRKLFEPPRAGPRVCRATNRVRVTLGGPAAVATAPLCALTPEGLSA